MKLQLSNSAKDTFLECPYKYKLHYIDKIRVSDNYSALMFGVALDKALNELLLKNPNYLNIFEKEWDSIAGLDIEYYKSDTDLKLLQSLNINREDFSDKDLAWLSLKAKGFKLLNNYYNQILPQVEIAESQRTVNIDMGEYTIKGILDLTGTVDGKLFVLDNKTTSESYKLNYINERDQLPLYSYATGIRDVGYLTLNKKNYKCDIILGKVEQSSIDRVLNTFNEVYEKIKNNLFVKNKKSCYSFGRKCPYYDLCHKGKISKNLYRKKD